MENVKENDEPQPQEQSRKPQDTAFKQQRLKAWQPILTPTYVIGSFALLAILFIPIGAVILQVSRQVVEVSNAYSTNTACAIGTQSPNYGKVCTINITIPKDMGLPVFVYYELKNFYQNHRRYVKSRDDSQLMGDSDGSSTCEPLEKVGGKMLYPCGLIAASYFSDRMTSSWIPGNGDETARVLNSKSDPTLASHMKNPFWSKKDIAWKTDITEKFKNNDKIISELTTGTSTQFTNQGPEQVNIQSVSNNAHVLTIPLPEDQDLIVWMRTAALPTFRKLYRVIRKLPNSDGSQSTLTAIPAGSTIQLTITNFFRVEEFDGKKSIVLSTNSFLGGKNDFLGLAYIIVGSVCLAFAVAFLIKHLVSPRKLGDMRYATWNQQAAS
eukprot:193175_1